MARKERKDAAQPARAPVRLSVPVSVEVHAKIAALAILRGLERSELAASFLEAAVRGCVIQERGGGDSIGSADPPAGI